MSDLRFWRLKSNAGIFIYNHNGKKVVVVVYVDDALFLGHNLGLLAHLKSKFMKIQECRDLGETKDFLRMRIIQKNHSIMLNQSTYVNA